MDDIKSAVNDFPWGVGLAYDFGVTGKPEGDGFFDGFIMSAEFSIFKDSDFGYPAAFIGTGFRKNVLEQLQLGIATGLIYTTQLEELSGFPILPFIFPVVQSDFDFPINLRVIYIPPISDLKSQQIFITIFTKIN